jgi:hypothetical protein
LFSDHNNSFDEKALLLELWAKQDVFPVKKYYHFIATARSRYVNAVMDEIRKRRPE